MPAACTVTGAATPVTTGVAMVTPAAAACVTMLFANVVLNAAALVPVAVMVIWRKGQQRSAGAISPAWP